MNVFSSRDYRDILKTCVLERKKSDTSFNYQRLADAIRAQSPYLSKVLAGSAELSEDQMYLACEHLRMSTEQTEYLLLLLSHSRTSLKKRKEAIARKIEEIRERHSRTQDYISASVAPSLSEIQDYYLDPFLQIVHISLTVDRYSYDLGLLAEKLNSSKERVLSALNRLEQMGFVQRKGHRISVLKTDIHLPQDSPLYPHWRQHLRQLSLGKMSLSASKSDYSLSVIFSADRKTRDKIKNGFLDFLKNAEALVATAKAEETYQLNFDLMAWTCE